MVGGGYISLVDRWQTGAIIVNMSKSEALEPKADGRSLERVGTAFNARTIYPRPIQSPKWRCCPSPR